jgi:hypothetical protein
MASQQDLLANLQALTRQAQGGVPRMVQPTSRTNGSPSPYKKASGYPDITEGTSASGGVFNPDVTKTQQQQFKLNTSARVASSMYPDITEQVASAKAGQKQPGGTLGILAGVLDNPIAKTVLAPLAVLDYGRRGIISGVREIADVLDTDKNTKISIGDWFKQTKDPLYGFGTAFPMPGKLGRVVGLVGDLALDPINWLTLGTRIPAGLTIKGLREGAQIGARIGAKEFAEAGAHELASLGPAQLINLQRAAAVEEKIAQAGVSARTMLGRRLTNTWQGKTKLAALVDQLGGSPELVAAVGKNGRRAMRAGVDGTQEGIKMAQTIGLGKSGLSFHGTKFVIPFTGPIADVLETGLARTKGAILRSSPIDWMAEHFIASGTNQQRAMRELRRGLTTGKMMIDGVEKPLSAEVARYAVRLHGMDSIARGIEEMAKDTYGKRLENMFNDFPEIRETKDTLHQFLDAAPEKWARPMTEIEQRAYNKVKPLWEQMHAEVEQAFQKVDPSFTLNRFENYLPHMMTDQAKDYIGKRSSQYAEEVRQYLKVNMTDPSASFKNRGLVKDAMFFGEKLTADDVSKGVVRLNEIARSKGFMGNFFETDMEIIFRKYGEHYASSMSNAEFMRLAKEGGILSEAKQMGNVSQEWLRQQADYAKSLRTGVSAAHKEMAIRAGAAIKTINEYMDVVRGNISGENAGGLRYEVDALQKVLKKTGTPEETFAALTSAREALVLAQKESLSSWANYVNALEKGSVVVQAMQAQVDKVDNAINEVLKELDRVGTNYAQNISRIGAPLADDVGQIDSVIGRALVDSPIEMGEQVSYDDLIKSLDAKFAALSEQLDSLTTSWEKSLSVENVVNDIIDGKIKLNDQWHVSSSDTGVADSLHEAIYGGLDVEKPNVLVQMNRRNISSIWDEVNLTPEMKVIKSIFDPEGKITSTRLGEIRLDDTYVSKVVNGKRVYTSEVKTRGIYSRIASGTTEANNITELREAGIWLIVRDTMHDPQFAKLISNGLTDTSTSLEKATYNRYQNLQELLLQSHAMGDYNFSAKSATIVNGIEKTKSRISGLEDDLREVIAKWETGESTLVSEEQYNKVLSSTKAKINKLEQEVLRKTEGLDKYQQLAVATAGTPTGYRDLVSDLASGVQEYFLHRETTVNFNRAMQTADTIDMVLPLALWNTTLAEVAKPLLASKVAYKKQLQEAQQVILDLQNAVSKNGNNISDTEILAIRERLLATEQTSLRTKTVKVPKQDTFYPELPGKWGPEKEKILKEMLGEQTDPVDRANIREHVRGMAIRVKTLETEQPIVKGAKSRARVIERAGEWGPQKQRLLDAELSQSNNIDNSIVFREEIAKIFRAERKVGKRGKVLSDSAHTPEELALLRKKELLDNHFPELRSIWIKSRTSQRDILFYKHAGAFELENDVIAALQDLGLQSDLSASRGARRSARNVVFGGTNEAVPEGMSIVGQSAEQRAATIAGKYRGRIRDAINQLEREVIRSEAKLTSGSRGLTTNVGDVLREEVKTKKARITELGKRFDAMDKEVDVDRKLAGEQLKALQNQSDIRAAKGSLKKLIDSGDQYGYAKLIDSILTEGTSDAAVATSRRSLANFFSEILGGDTSYYIGTLGRREKRTITDMDSFFGRTTRRVDSHIVGLKTLVDDTNLPTNKMLEGVPGQVGSNGRYMPGNWLMRTELRGAEGMASALEEHANRLLTAVESAKRNPVDIRLAEKRLATAQRAGHRLQAQIDDMAATPDFVRAQTRLSEHQVIMALAGADDKVAEKLGFTRFEIDSLFDEPLRQTDVLGLRKQEKQLIFERNRLMGQRERVVKSRGMYEARQMPIEAKLSEVEDSLLDVQKQLMEHESRGSALEKLGSLTRNLEDSNLQKQIAAESGIEVRFATDAPTAKSGTYTNPPAGEFRLESTGSKTRYESAPSRKLSYTPSEFINLLSDYGDTPVLEKVVRSRRAKLVKAWNSSNEGKFLDEYKQLHNQWDVNQSGIWHEQTGWRKVSKRERAIRAEIDSLRETQKETLLEIPKLQKQIIDIIDNETALTTQNIPKGKNVPLESRVLAEEATGVSEGLKLNPSGTLDVPRYAAPNRAKIAGKKANIIGEKDSIDQIVNDLEFDKVVERGLQKQALEYIGRLSKEEQVLLKEKIVANARLAKAMETKELMLDGKVAKKVSSAYAFEVTAKQGVQKAQEAFDNAVNLASWGPQRLVDAQRAVDDLAKMAKDGRYWKSTIRNSGNAEWLADVDQFIDDSSYLVSQVSPEGVPKEIRAVTTEFIKARTAYLTKTSELTAKQEEFLFNEGIRGMKFAGTSNKFIPMELRGKIPEDKFSFVSEFDKGFVELSKFFPNIQVKEELAAIISNVHRLKDPIVVREFSNFMSKYTSFFKAYATLSPGFHIRNGMSNSFMLFAGGGDLGNLSEGLRMSKSWLEASKRGLNVEQWIKELPVELRGRAENSMSAFFQSGGGMTSDFFQTGKSFRGTKTSKKAGRWVENHSRFMMSWDGVAQGLDAEAAAIRTRRFLIDYSDISTGDRVMRQIVPFWMWTSRNLPMQISNMWINPKAYATYNSIKRNFNADKEGDVVPAWMQELGAFKLPFGKDLYATPDFGFNRVGQQIKELQEPQRLLSNVNPLLRVPVELMGGRQLYSNRPFSQNPVKVENGAGAILQPFLQGLGFGETGPNGDKFVNDKAYYGFRNFIPFAGTAERLTPSIDTYQQRGYINPLLGFLGVPNRKYWKENNDKATLYGKQGRGCKRFAPRHKGVH